MQAIASSYLIVITRSLIRRLGSSELLLQITIDHVRLRVVACNITWFVGESYQ